MLLVEPIGGSRNKIPLISCFTISDPRRRRVKVISNIATIAWNLPASNNVTSLRRYFIKRACVACVSTCAHSGTGELQLNYCKLTQNVMHTRDIDSLHKVDDNCYLLHSLRACFTRVKVHDFDLSSCAWLCIWSLFRMYLLLVEMCDWKNLILFVKDGY